MLDHILLGCSDLERGIDFVKQRTGVLAAPGGVHPGRGTQNALLSIGTRRYLEIIAPDPEQKTDDPFAKKLKGMSEPRLVNWAAHTDNIAALAGKLKAAGIGADGPHRGSRKRPDGKTLQWQTLGLKDDSGGLLPFFIEWSANSPHPSLDAPAGAKLLAFEIVTPRADALMKFCSQAGLEVHVVQGHAPQLRATITGTMGGSPLTISS